MALAHQQRRTHQAQVQLQSSDLPAEVQLQGSDLPAEFRKDCGALAEPGLSSSTASRGQQTGYQGMQPATADAPAGGTLKVAKRQQSASGTLWFSFQPANSAWCEMAAMTSPGWDTAPGIPSCACLQQRSPRHGSCTLLHQAVPAPLFCGGSTGTACCAAGAAAWRPSVLSKAIALSISVGAAHLGQQGHV